MFSFMILLAFVALVVAWLGDAVQRAGRARNAYRNAFAQIDVQLQRRFDLVPNLVETARAYLTHERETLEAVVAARGAAQAGLSAAKASPGDPAAMAELSRSQGALDGVLGRFMAVVDWQRTSPDAANGRRAGGASRRGRLPPRRRHCRGYSRVAAAHGRAARGRDAAGAWAVAGPGPDIAAGSASRSPRAWAKPSPTQCRARATAADLSPAPAAAPAAGGTGLSGVAPAATAGAGRLPGHGARDDVCRRQGIAVRVLPRPPADRAGARVAGPLPPCAVRPAQDRQRCSSEDRHAAGGGRACRPRRLASGRHAYLARCSACCPRARRLHAARGRRARPGRRLGGAGPPGPAGQAAPGGSGTAATTTAASAWPRPNCCARSAACCIARCRRCWKTSDVRLQACRRGSGPPRARRS